MSTPLGTEFGSIYGEDYGEILSGWGKKLKGVSKISNDMRQEWVADLRTHLERQLVETLQKQGIEKWKAVGDTPSKEVIEVFAKTAAKKSLATDHFDLLERLRLMAQEPDSVTAAITVDEAIQRSSQTLSQIFDMVNDTFNKILENTLRRKKKLTGRRRWKAVGEDSRHKELNGRIKKEGEEYYYKGNTIYGPRPAGGSPEHWSNCSCYLEYERANGSWVRM